MFGCPLLGIELSVSRETRLNSPLLVLDIEMG